MSRRNGDKARFGRKRKNRSGADLKFENFAKVCDSSLECRAADRPNGSSV